MTTQRAVDTDALYQENLPVNVDFTGKVSVNIVHDLGVFPSVTVIEAGVEIVPASITHNTVNNFTIAFSDSTSGTIIYR